MNHIITSNISYTVIVLCVHTLVPEDLANVMKVSSMILSTAERAPRIRDCATAMAPRLMNSRSPGWERSMLVRNASNQIRYLYGERMLIKIKPQVLINM